MNEYSEQNTFGQRLEQILTEKGISQKKLADKVGVKKSTVNAWINGDSFPRQETLKNVCRVLGVSVDWLLALWEGKGDGIVWNTSYPNNTTNELREDIRIGLETFHLLVNERLSSKDVQDILGSREQLRAAIKIALNCEALQITSVPTDQAREANLIGLFPNLEVIVADIPNYDTDIIRTELVAFLAAKRIFDNLSDQKVIGVGAGYTLSRVAQLSLPRQMTGTKYIPLMQVPGELVNHLSANFIANLLTHRHPGSESMYFPHMHENPSSYARKMYQKIIMESLNMEHIFVSVNGLGKEKRDPKTRFRTSDGDAHPSWDAAKLLGERHSNFAMEILGLLLDAQGRPLNLETQAIAEEIYPDMPMENKEELLGIVRRVAAYGRVWIIAAGRHKAEPTFWALQNGLCNGLVIDAEIADYVIKRKREIA